jgi:hypothetical protein
MKIDCGWKEKTIDELIDGALFYYKGHFYIATDKSPEYNMRSCLELDSGCLIGFEDSITVLIVEDVVLKIGGYYK